MQLEGETDLNPKKKMPKQSSSLELKVKPLVRWMGLIELPFSAGATALHSPRPTMLKGKRNANPTTVGRVKLIANNEHLLLQWLFLPKIRHVLAGRSKARRPRGVKTMATYTCRAVCSHSHAPKKSPPKVRRVQSHESAMSLLHTTATAQPHLTSS